MTMSELKKNKQNFDVKKGITFDVFKVGIKSLKYESEWLAKRIFDECNEMKSNEFLDWEHFLLAVKAIQAKQLDQKVDLFFKIIDQDGNGQLSYDEVYEICSSSFQRFSIKDDYITGLTEFFTSIIFRAVGK